MIRWWDYIVIYIFADILSYIAINLSSNLIIVGAMFLNAYYFWEWYCALRCNHEQ
jgi:hypothetical protein